MELPKGYYGAIVARSGLATKQGLRPANAYGVIDSDYRGSVIVALHNDTDYQTKIVIKQEEPLLIVNIPKIHLKKNVYNINSKLNNISKNIKILPNSNINRNYFLLAAHSGNNINTYFNDLIYLSVEDKIYIQIKNKIYTYSINNIYYINKTGYLEIDEDNSDTLTLITCSLKYKNKQLIIESKLINTNKM